MYDNSSRVIEADIDEILPNRFQPRIQFDEEEILELSDSIKEHGVIQPIVVRTVGDKYEIIAGERRYKASVLAGKETVPVIVKNLNDKDSAEIALIENVQRKNLTPIEEALSYKKILDMGYLTQENLASKLGKSQSAIANKIRLLNLSDEVQEALLENKISERHARSLLKLETVKDQNDMLNRIINERLTVRKTDEEIEKMKTSESDSQDDSEGTEKIIEKGEMNMDNMLGTANAATQQSSTQGFDIFGGAPVAQPANESTVEQPMMATAPTFDLPSTPVTQSATETMPGVPPTQGFNILGGAPVAQPTNESTVEQPTNQTTPTFDLSSAPASQPATETMPGVPPTQGFNILGGAPVAQPTSESTVEQPIMPTPTFDLPSAPVAPPAMETMPEVSSVQEQPKMPSFELPTMPQQNNGTGINSNLNSISQMQSAQVDSQIPVINQQEVNAEQPTSIPEFTLPNVEQSVPQTAPIVESKQYNSEDTVNQMTQQSDDLFSFEAPTPVSQESAPVVEQQTNIPEPIIVTDYSKQYDPIMPEQTLPQTPKVEFKEVINAIRECSSKIEQYGFKIDVEEYDLANLYQVVFKVEK